MRQPTPPITLPAATAEACAAFADTCAQIVGFIIEYLFRRLHGLGPAPLATLILQRISRANQRTQRLMRALAAGTWRAPRLRAPRTHKAPNPTAEPRPKPLYISQAKGWIGQRYGFFIRGIFGQFEHLITKPETQALLAELPPEAIRSLGRTVRPLCRLFGITPPKPLQRDKPKRVRPPRPRKERMPRPPRSRRALLRALKSCLKPKGMAIWPDRIAARRKSE